jgi:membrane protease YdiL (CAAX protease family)
MSAIQTAVQPQTRTGHLGIADRIKQHPLLAYFLLAFGLTWFFLAPIVLSQRGLNLIALPDEALLILFLISTFIGPTPAAFIVTGVTEGRAGVKQLLKRMVQWRVGIQWYLLVLIGYPLVLMLGVAVVRGAEPFTALLSSPQLLVTSYLPMILIGIIYPSIGEEPGWRGFALTRMQARYGPLFATLMLGALHALWHLPAYTIPGAITPNGFDPVVFVANSLAIVAATVLWTWLFNNARGSILFAMFVHATSNAVSGLIPRLVAESTGDPFFGFKVFLVVAVVLIVLTRGKLAYERNRSAQEVKV